MSDEIKSGQLLELLDSIADEILNMSEDEILSDMEEEGIGITTVRTAFSSIMESSRNVLEKRVLNSNIGCGQSVLSRSRAEIREERQRERSVVQLSATRAREIIERAQREISEFTLAALNKDNNQLSDQEAIEIAQSLIRLGFPQEAE